MKRGLSNLETGVLLGCAIAIMGIVQCGISDAQAVQAVDKEIEEAVLAESWAKAAKLLGEAEPGMLPAVARIINGHAKLALNRNNDSLCSFLSISSENELKEWEKWTKDFVNSNPKTPITYYLKGDASARLEKWDEALNDFNKALEISPQHAMVLNARGVVHAIRGRWDKAIEDFEKTKVANSVFADAYANIGAMWIQKSDGAPGALRAFKAALVESPDFVLALYGKGAVEMVLGELGDSSKDLEMAMKKDECVKPFVAIQVTEMLQTLNHQEEKELAIVDGKLPGTEIQKKFLSNVDQIKAGNFGGWNGPLNQAIKLMRKNPELEQDWKNSMKDISPQVNKRLQTTMTHRGNSVDGWWSKMGSLRPEINGDYKPGGVGVGGKLGIDMTRPADFKMRTGDLQVWKDAKQSLPKLSNPSGFDTTIDPAMWDKGNWPFNAQFGLLYKPNQRNSQEDK